MGSAGEQVGPRPPHGGAIVAEEVFTGERSLNPPHDLAILGAGIGGLTTAVALARLGLFVPVYDASPADAALGGGLMIAHNGMQVMQQLGLRDAVEQAGYPIQHLWLTDAKLSLLRDVSFASLDVRYGLGHVAVQRARLRRVLLDALPDGTVRYGKSAQSLEQHEDRVVVQFGDGESVTTRTLIAADGLHSIARRVLQPEYRPRFCGQAAWTGVCRGPVSPELAQTIEAWGPQGTRMVTTPLSQEETYWVAITDASPNNGPALQEVQAILNAHFHPLLAALPRNTASRGTYQWYFHDMPRFAPWHAGRTVFLGDAAHATTPNLGQGANQAMEDALTLASALAEAGADFQAAFTAYHKARTAKAQRVIGVSHTWGVVAHWRHPWLLALRNLALRALPGWASLRVQSELARVMLPEARTTPPKRLPAC